jgi:phosphopentomutase
MRALLLVLDGVGCGQTPDSAAFGDEGAHTLGHVFAGDLALALPALFSLGLWKILTVDVFDARSRGTIGSFGRMRPRSPGKDSTSGHWEIAGVVLTEPFATFTKAPLNLVEAIAQDARVEFLNAGAVGEAAALDQFAQDHLRTRRPILFTSADSVLHIAAHESIIPHRRLHEIGRLARRHADASRISRIVARPFVGEAPRFQYAEDPLEFGMVPPRTILNSISETGLRIEGVGKINELFGSSGITHTSPAASNADATAAIDQLWGDGMDGLIFANLPDFDLHGHHRDVHGYRDALLSFDLWLAGFLGRCEEEDLVIITADHGNDPTWNGTDHTREEVPLMVFHGNASLALGTRTSFADVAATLSAYFRLRHPWAVGESFISLQQRHPRSYFHRA